MPHDEITLIGYTRRAVAYLKEHPKSSADEIAVHLGLDLPHTRDVMFRARQRGLVRKHPVSFSLTKVARRKIEGLDLSDPVDPEAGAAE